MQPILLVAGINVQQCPAALQQVSPAERGAVTIVTKEPATVGAVYSAVQLYSGVQCTARLGVPTHRQLEGDPGPVRTVHGVTSSAGVPCRVLTVTLDSDGDGDDDGVLTKQ